MADPEDAPPAPEDAVLDDVPPFDFDLRVALDSIPFRAGGVVVEPEVPALLRGDAGRLRWLLSALAGGRPSATLAVALEEESRSGFLLYFAVRGEGTAPLPAEPGRRTLLEEAARRLGGRLGNGACFTNRGQSSGSRRGPTKTSHAECRSQKPQDIHVHSR